MGIAADAKAAGRAALAYADFRAYLAARFCIVIALEMQSVAVGWQVYEITRRPLDLGLIGLAQFLPGFALFLPAGHAVDRLDRRRVLTSCYAGSAVCSALLLTIALRGTASVYPIYAVVVLLGAIRAFSFPASRALLPQLLPQEHFPNAVAWHSSIFQAGTILGPACGGLLYAFFHGAAGVYATAMLVALGASLSTQRIKAQA